MSTITRRSAAALAALALAAAATGCGGDDDATSNVSASGTSAAGATSSSEHSGHSGHGGSTDAAGGEAATMRMQRLGSTSAGDQKVELDVSEPVTFSVYEGERLVKHEPREGENAHIMLLLSDAQSGDRLPDATITLRITDEAGKVVSSGPQYPMIGMGMGIHYGDNVTIPKAGKYVAQLVIGPPRIGRHSDVTDRWNTTTRASIPFQWKGSAR